MPIKDLFDANPLYLMDGSAFVYRGFYANQSMQRTDGFPTSALFIVAKTLLKILREEEPQHFAFILDGRGSNFRHELFALYKANRSGMPETLAMQMDSIKRLITALGLHLVVSDGAEADDCIASLAFNLRSQLPIVLVGADKDLRQCLHDNVLMWDPGKDEKITTKTKFIAETGLQPSQWPDFQAIIGDSSDNIPGIAGIGPKTAEKIFQTHKSLEEIRDGFTMLPPALRKKFSGQLEAMFLYRQLTTLKTDQCNHLSLTNLQVQPLDLAAASTFMREFELFSLERELYKLAKSGLNPATTTQLSLEIPSSVPRKLIQNIQDLPPLANCKLSLLHSAEETVLAYNPTPSPNSAKPNSDSNHPQTSNLAPNKLQAPQEFVYQGAVEPLIQALQAAELIITPDLKTLWHDYPIWEAIHSSKWFDLSLASYLLAPDERDHAWPKLSAQWGSSPKNPGLAALSIYDHLRTQLVNANLWTLFADLEMPLIPILHSMEKLGVKLDAQALKEFLHEVQADLDNLTQNIYTHAGGAFNIRSAQQLGEVLYSRLKLPSGAKTKGGQAGTSQDILEKLSDEHAIIDTLLEFRKLEKMRSTYLEPLPKLMDAHGRIHTTFNQLGTATGRLSSKNPNMQNIPVRGPLGQRMRTCFTAPQGTLLLSADYSQIELRVLAHFSQDKTLMQAFKNKADIHSSTAALIYDKPQAEINTAERRVAKTINFGLIYGMGQQKLAKELNISQTEAKLFITRYFSQLQDLKKFYDQVEEQAVAAGLVTTITNRRRLLPDLHSKNVQAKALAKRQAINTIIQGSAADIIKLAMLDVAKDQTLQACQAKLLLQVHDELLLEVPIEYAQTAGEQLAKLMTQVLNKELTVPLEVEWGMANNWGLAH